MLKKNYRICRVVLYLTRAVQDGWIRWYIWIYVLSKASVTRLPLPWQISFSLILFKELFPPSPQQCPTKEEVVGFQRTITHFLMACNIFFFLIYDKSLFNNFRIEYFWAPHCFACEKFFSAHVVDLKFGGQDPMAGKLNRIEQTGPRTLHWKGTNQSN